LRPSTRAARGLAIRVLINVGLCSNWLGGHAIATVDPPGEILKLAALAAEGNPGCLGELAVAKNTDARRHGFTFY